MRSLFLARAIISTFLGPPPTVYHTAEHKDQNRGNDVLSNIIWEDKSGQRLNQTRPVELNTAYIIVKDDVEHTAKEWVDIFKKPNGKNYTIQRILQFAQEHNHGFRYKVFSNLRGEVWKSIPGSKNSRGEWLISTKNRMKYKTNHAENVLAVDQLITKEGYPSVCINGKQLLCHYLSMMTFRPREYAAKLPDDIVLHKNDDRFDFNPFRLRWGTHTENRTDAHNNGKYDGTKTERKPVSSYIDGVFEKTHESSYAAAEFLQENGYPNAIHQGVRSGLNINVIRYGRTWLLI
ncbi:hypothetical protein ATCVNEJV2_116L [Acanthocystis turfacea Chlorella virus NE-JV-2]|nr:hypothetical protein ATCVNEJV2_116L [Acanthocystis turfacea Chlorella virus NE-JV-2]